MANATPSRLGQINNTGSADALFLKVFAGEVLTAFAEKNVMADKVMARTIAAGKSAQFPLMGKVGAEYHVPGTELTGLNLPAAERLITIDDVLLSHTFISNIDEAKNHYDVRSTYSTEMGFALANQMDKHLLQMGVLAARDVGGVVTGEPGGGLITLTATPSVTELQDAIFAAAQTFDEKDIPEDERYFYIRPADYYKLIKDTKAINQDWKGAGSYSDGQVTRIAGLQIVATNHIPSTVVAGGTVAAGTGNKYAGDFSKVVGLAMQKTCLGTVKLLDLGMESEYDIRRQGTLMVAKYLMGHGILRPGAAFEVRKA